MSQNKSGTERSVEQHEAAPAETTLQECMVVLLERTEAAEADAFRYRFLRDRDLDSINAGGVFAGKTPDNVVLNGADLDAAIDAESGVRFYGVPSAPLEGTGNGAAERAAFYVHKNAVQEICEHGFDFTQTQIFARQRSDNYAPVYLSASGVAPALLTALTDERIDALWCQRFNGVEDRTSRNAEIRNFARMVERAARAPRTDVAGAVAEGRDQFERYAQQMGKRDFGQNEFGDYQNPFTQEPWNFWRASRDAISAPSADAAAAPAKGESQ